MPTIIPKVIALFSTTLAAKISASATSGTLDKIEDKKGTNLTGVVGIVVDGGTASQEFMIVTIASDKSFTVTYRGIDPIAPYTEVTALKFSHERNASVKVTNYPILLILRNLLNGDTAIPNLLKYDGALTPTDPAHLTSKNYVDTRLTAAGGVGSLLVIDAGDLKVDVNSGYYVLNGNVEKYNGVSDQSLTDDAINYAEMVDGVLSVNVVGFSDDSMPLAKITCASGDITELVDCRAFFNWLDIKANYGINRDATGIFVDLDTLSGLEFNDGKLRVKIKANGGMVRDADGLSLSVNPLTYINAGATIDGATLPVPTYQDTTDGELYACDGNDASKLNFLGFVISNSTSGNPATLQTEGIVGGFANLTKGLPYYVQDAVGTIGLVQGTYSVQVGVAISATEILIQKSPRIVTTSQVASDTLKFSNDTDNNTMSLSYVKVKEIRLNENCPAVRIKFYLSNATRQGYGKIYKNGVAIGTERSKSQSGETFSEDFTGFVAGDLIQLYAKASNGDDTANVSAFRLYFDRTIVNINDIPLITPLPVTFTFAPNSTL